MTIGVGLNLSCRAVEKHDQNKYAHQQSFQQPYQQPQQSSRTAEGVPTYGKYIAPDGTEYPVYQPQPQFQGTFQPVQPQYQNQSSRSIGYEPSQPQNEQRSIRQGSRSPLQPQEGYFQAPASSTPPPYQYDRKS